MFFAGLKNERLSSNRDTCVLFFKTLAWFRRQKKNTTNMTDNPITPILANLITEKQTRDLLFNTINPLSEQRVTSKQFKQAVNEGKWIKSCGATLKELSVIRDALSEVVSKILREKIIKITKKEERKLKKLSFVNEHMLPILVWIYVSRDKSKEESDELCKLMFGRNITKDQPKKRPSKRKGTVAELEKDVVLLRKLTAKAKKQLESKQ